MPATPTARGFTLVELMVAVTVMAILVGMIAWAGGKALKQSEIQKTQTIMQVLEEAIQVFHNDRGYYPGYGKIEGKPFGYWVIPYNPDGPSPPERSLPPVNVPPKEPIQPRYDMLVNGNAVDLYLPKTGGYGEPDDSARAYSIQCLMYVLQTDSRSDRILNNLPESTVFSTGSNYFNSRLRATLKKNPTYMIAYNIDADLTKKLSAIEALTVIDAWGTPLCYAFDNNINNGIPFLWSAGPNMKFEPVENPSPPPDPWDPTGTDTLNYFPYPKPGSDDIVSFERNRQQQ